MKNHFRHTHSMLRVVITAFAIVCLLSLAAIPFSSSAHAATNTHSTLGVSQATTNNQKVAQQAVSTMHGCPLGYACIYPQDAGWNGDRPSYKYYYYGTDELYNQFGTHNVVNNQTDHAVFQFCFGSHGTSCFVNNTMTVIIAGQSGQINLTPYNSVFLGESPRE